MAPAVPPPARVKQEGLENDLLERLADDPVVGMTPEEHDAVLDVREFIGRAPQQVMEFIEGEVQPVLVRHAGKAGVVSDVRV